MGWKSTIDITRNDALKRIGALLMLLPLERIRHMDLVAIRASSDVELGNLLELLEGEAGPTGEGYCGYNFVIGNRPEED